MNRPALALAAALTCAGCYLSSTPASVAGADAGLERGDAAELVEPRAVDAGEPCGVRWVCRCTGDVCTRSDGAPCRPDDIRDPADYCP